MDIPLILSNSGNYLLTRTQSVQYIVMHYTANNGDTARNNGSYFQNNSVGVSAHYFTDETEFIQSVPDTSVAYHCGTTGTYYHASCRNTNSIGVELCSRIDASGAYYFLDETIANAVVLVKYLMEKYSVPVENVIRHYDVTHKTCPAPWVNDSAAWSAFLTSLTEVEIDEEIIPEEEEDMVYYEREKDIPDFGKDTVAKLIEKKVLLGEGEDDDGLILNLEHNMLRMLVIHDRLGLYG